MSNIKLCRLKAGGFKNKSTLSNHLTPLSLGVAASIILTGSVAADDTDPAVSGLSQVSGSQATAISQVITQRYQSLPADKPSAFDGLLLADAGTVTTQATFTNDRRSITQATIDELTSVDTREIDDIAARLKEIIHARHSAENQRLQSLHTVGELQTQLVELEALLHNANAQKEALHMDQAALQEKLNQMIVERDSAQNDLNLINDELRGQVGSVQALQAETLSATEQLQARNNEIASLTGQLDALTSERQEALTTADDLTDQLLQNQSALDDLTIQYNAVSSERDNLLTTSDQLSNDIALKDNSLVELQAQLDTMAEDRAEAQQQIAELQTELDSQEQMLAAKLTDLGSKDSLLNTVKMQLQSVAEEKDTYIDRVAELDAHLTEKSNSLADLEARLAGLESEKEEARHQIELLKDRLVISENAAGEVLASNDQLAGKLSLLETNADESQQAFFTEQQAHIQTQAMLDALEIEASQLRAEIDSLTAERNELHTENEELSANSSQMLGTKKAMQKNLDIYALNLQTATDDAAKLEDEVALLSTKRDEATAKVRSLTDQLDALKKEINVVKSEQQRKLDDINKSFGIQKAKLETTITEQQGALDELNEATAQQDNNIADLTSKIAMLEVKNQKQNDAAQKMLVEKDNRLIKLGEQIAALKLERERLNSLNQEGRVEFNKITSRLQGLMKGQDASNLQITELQTLNGDLSEQIAALKRQLEVTTTDRDQTIDGLNSEIAQLLATNADTEKREAAALRQVSELTTATDALMAEKERVITEAERLRLSLTDQLNTANLNAVSVESARPDNSIPIRLGNADFFTPGSARLTREGAENLTKLAKIIEKFDERRIVVEGHTDSVPIGPGLKDRFESNWELSVARAATAVRHMQSHASIDPRQMNAAGFGEYKPLASNDTEAGRQKNRRVEVVLYPLQDEYETISSFED